MQAYCALFSNGTEKDIERKEKDFENLVQKKGYNRMACEIIDKLQHKDITNNMKYFGIEFTKEEVQGAPINKLRSYLKEHLNLVDRFGNISTINVVAGRRKELKPIKRTTKYIKVDHNIVSPSPSRRGTKRMVPATPTKTPSKNNRFKLGERKEKKVLFDWEKGTKNKVKCLRL